MPGCPHVAVPNGSRAVEDWKGRGTALPSLLAAQRCRELMFSFQSKAAVVALRGSPGRVTVGRRRRVRLWRDQAGLRALLPRAGSTAPRASVGGRPRPVWLRWSVAHCDIDYFVEQRPRYGPRRKATRSRSRAACPQGARVVEDGSAKMRRSFGLDIPEDGEPGRPASPAMRSIGRSAASGSCWPLDRVLPCSAPSSRQALARGQARFDVPLPATKEGRGRPEGVSAAAPPSHRRCAGRSAGATAATAALAAESDRWPPLATVPAMSTTTGLRAPMVPRAGLLAYEGFSARLTADPRVALAEEMKWWSTPPGHAALHRLVLPCRHPCAGGRPGADIRTTMSRSMPNSGVVVRPAGSRRHRAADPRSPATPRPSASGKWRRPGSVRRRKRVR